MKDNTINEDNTDKETIRRKYFKHVQDNKETWNRKIKDQNQHYGILYFKNIK
jgi:hypothetical protein